MLSHTRWLVVAAVLASVVTPAVAQDEASSTTTRPTTTSPTTTRPTTTSPTTTSPTTSTATGDAEAAAEPALEEAPSALPFFGAFVPQRGFTVANTELGELTIGTYILARYLNQLPLEPTFVDHLGRERTLDPRNDINVHRVLIYFSGWIFDPNVRYGATVWTSNSTTQVAVIGYLGYVFGDALQLFVGVGSLPGTHSLRYVFPYWLGTDRRMADEFFRPSFTSGIWATGKPLPWLNYQAMIGNSLSQLGIDANQLDRDFAYSASVWIEPTTGEYGPRGAIGDYEFHDRIATRIGISATTSREDRFAQPGLDAPENTQIRLTDGVLLFETGSLAPDVTIEKATYTMGAVDAGLKYRGFTVSTELYVRLVNDFLADGPLPVDSLLDVGLQVQTSIFLWPKLLEVYGVVSGVRGAQGASRELALGANLRPFGTRNLRFNGEFIYLDHSPTGGLFTPYLAGMTGPVIHASMDLFF